MLKDSIIYPTIPAKDINRAKQFYADKLGLTPEKEDETHGLMYKSGGCWFYLYQTQFAGTAQNTAAAWKVDNVEQTVADLRAKGVVFEEYDMPGLKTVNGIAEMGGIKGAWFKDSEGNILSVGEFESEG